MEKRVGLVMIPLGDLGGGMVMGLMWLMREVVEEVLGEEKVSLAPAK